MEMYFKKIKALLGTSTLTPQDQDELLVALLLTPDEQLQPVYELLSSDIMWANKLFKNYRSKKGAVDHDDSNFWETIMKEEEQIAAEIEE